MAMLICWTAAAGLLVPALLFSRLDLQPAWARHGFAWSLPAVAALVAAVVTVAGDREVSEDDLYAAVQRASWHMPAYNDALALGDRVFAELGEEVATERVGDSSSATTQDWEVRADDAVVCVRVDGGDAYATSFREAAVSVARGACGG